MKKLITLITILFASFLAFGQNLPIQNLPKAISTTKEIGEISENGEKIGEWKWYYENGQMEMIENYDEHGNLTKTIKY